MILGLDLGSTSLKAIIYDLDGNVVAKGAKPTQRFHPNPERPEWTTWDPDQIWNDTAAACREAVAQIADPSSIRGVAVAGMGMDGVPMDDRGNWLYPFISWHDPRTKPQFDWWIKNIGSEKTFSVGGNPVWVINSALRMLWIKENEPDIFKNTYKWLLIEDFVNQRLSGKYCTDFSMASCTMLFDQTTQTWSDEMCSLAGIPKAILPDAFQSATSLGEITQSAAAQTGLPPGTPIFLGGHDHICSGIPVGAFHPGSVMDITGTWETVHVIREKVEGRKGGRDEGKKGPSETAEPFSPSPLLPFSLLKNGVTVQSHAIPGRYSMWGGNPAGEMIEWYRREIGAAHGSDWKSLIDSLESSSPGAGGTMFLPHLDSSSCPIVDPRSLGVFVGMCSRTKQADLLRAVFEGVNYQFLDSVRAMEEATGITASEFIAVGGAIRNTFWMQNKADMVGRPVRVPEVDEATVLGAAIVAGIGAGAYADADDAYRRVARESAVYQPREELTKLYDELFPIYRNLYTATAPINHALYEKFMVD